MSDEVILFQNSDGEFKTVKDEYTIYFDNEKDFEYVKSLVKIDNIIRDYAEQHPLAIENGRKFIMQEDKPQEDALELACDILEAWADEIGYEEHQNE